jgi:3-hydroxyisobutyrate dehydrogenase
MGIMGTAMAANLLKGGFAVTVWNRTASKCDPLREKGAKVAGSIGELAGSVDALCINVSDTPDVEAVIFGDGGVTSGARPGLTVIDHSTISPGATQHIAARLAERGIDFLDAPVSGGDVGARNGTLCIMVGGAAEVFARCMPVFSAMGKTIVHLGPAGMGQVCKACNQVAVVCNLMGVCEAMALAKKCGLDVAKMIEVVGGGAGTSWQLANLGPRILAGNFGPGFMVDLVLKDLAIVEATARLAALPLPATGLAEMLFRAVKADAGHGDGGKLGTHAMAKVFERLGGFSF